MATVQETLHDLAVLHRVGLSRYSTEVVRKVLAQLNRTEQSIIERLARTSNETVAGQRLETLLVEIRNIQAQGWAVVRERMNSAVTDLSGAEETFAERMVNLGKRAPTALQTTFSPVPTVDQIVAAVNARPFQGRFLKGWLDDAETGQAALVRDAIRQGFVEGQTTEQVIRTLRGTRAAQYRDGIMEISRRRAEAMVRTAMTHTANVATQATYKALGVQEWRFVATLDARTTLICMGLHGKVFPVGEGPQPPRHINCRSVTVPVVELPDGVEPMPFPTFDQWLKGQPVSVQDDLLGPTRAKLFRSGQMKVDRFTDRAGQVLTIDQLHQRDASAFKAAGLQLAA